MTKPSLIRKPPTRAIASYNGTTRVALVEETIPAQRGSSPPLGSAPWTWNAKRWP
jgi:hypothetical protein